MLSENFASALRDIRIQMQALVKENELLTKRVDEMQKQIDRSDDKVFRQQSKRIRQAAAADDYETLSTLNTGSISPVDAEIIRLAMPAETIESTSPAGVPNNALLAGMIQASREGRLVPPPRQTAPPANDNIQRALAQLSINGEAMATEAKLRQQNELRMQAAAQQEYRKRNNAMRSRSPEWAMEGDEIIDY